VGHGAKEWIHGCLGSNSRWGVGDDRHGTSEPGFHVLLEQLLPPHCTEMTDFKALPDDKVISEASNIDILNSKGEKVKFGSLFEQQKTIVVFIRMFSSKQIPFFSWNNLALLLRSLWMWGMPLSLAVIVCD